MKIKTCGLCAALVVLLAGTTVRATPIATVTLESQPGDPLGGGQNFDFTFQSTDEFFSAQVRRSLPDGLPAEVEFLFGNLTAEVNTMMFLIFGTQALGIPIGPGTYTNAQRADFALPGHPGIDIAFQQRECGTNTGSFVITNATFLPDGTISSFAASFEEQCLGIGGNPGPAPPLDGTLSYNANLPVEIPEPAGYSLMGIGLSLSIVRRWRIARS